MSGIDSPQTKAERTRSGMLVRSQRRHEYLRRRASGQTHEEIAADLGVSPSTVRRVIWGHLDRLAREDRENEGRVLQLELSRLDELERLLWPRAEAGQLSAVDRILKVMERRAKLLGLVQRSVSLLY